MIVRKQFIPPWEKHRKRGKLTFDDAFAQLGTNGEFMNAREITEPMSQPTPKL